jgi:ferrous-iron efflux pump FieF
VQGIMDRTDPEDNATIRRILNEEVAAGTIKGFHKVRYRHTGPFHWVDMHLQVDGGLSVAQGHDVASRIERRIEEALGEANATAHVEPWEEQGEAAGPAAVDAERESPRGEPSAEAGDTYPLKGEGE